VSAYRCIASSVEGFIQQLAVSYVTNGYWFYVTGRVPEGKAPEAVDQKLLAQYGVGISKWARSRRKENGEANVQYLRHDRFFVLLATHGVHPFFEGERTSIRDCRRTPLRYRGYAVSFRGGHAHVRIDQRRYREVKSYLLQLAVHREAWTVSEEFRRLPFEPYAPVRRQLFNILRAVNRVRRRAGFSAVGVDCLRLRRRITRPFAHAQRNEPGDGQGDGSGAADPPPETAGAVVCERS
jgi:hypothetical protein